MVGRRSDTGLPFNGHKVEQNFVNTMSMPGKRGVLRGKASIDKWNDKILARGIPRDHSSYSSSPCYQSNPYLIAANKGVKRASVKKNMEI